MSETYGGQPPSDQPLSEQPSTQPPPSGQPPTQQAPPSGQWPTQQAPPSEQWPTQQPPASGQWQSQQPPPSGQWQTQQPPASGQWPSQPAPAPVAPQPPRHADKPKTAWFVGVVLIVLGVIFLLEQFGWVFPGNWWAVFIYLGAAATFVNMWRQWRAAGWFDSKAAGSLTFGLVLVAVGTLAYFDVWDPYWPLILVAIGVGIVLGWVLGAATERQRN